MEIIKKITLFKYCAQFLILLIPFLAFASDKEMFPRGPGGKPDLNGIWQVFNTANYDLEAHSAKAAMSMVEGPVVPIPNQKIVLLGAVGSVPAGLGVVEEGEIPYRPWALKKKKENQKYWLERDPEIKCYLPGVPRATYMAFPFQIFHSEKAMMFTYEYAGAVRNILSEDPGPAAVDSWMGQSWGYWEEDTFIVKASGFNDKTWFDRAGNFHSDKLKVTERYTLIDKYHIDYQATIEDSEVFKEPWTIKMVLYKRVGKDAALQQFKCVDFVEELLYGHLRAKD